MATFFVGQRVRIVACNNAIQMHHVGKEGRILSACSVFDRCWDVAGATTNSLGNPCSWLEHHLEPILPEGHRAGDFTNVQDLLDSLTREHA